MNRPVIHVGSPAHMSVGPLQVTQTLPSEEIPYADPFILLHHAGPQVVEAGAPEHRVDPHPHRGFSPVTFVYRGAVLHRDSLGNESIVGPGEVQWIEAGRGIVHSEGAAPYLREQGGELELIQLWVNTPRAHKMDEPSYQEITKAKIPTIHRDGVQLNLVAGSFETEHGPVVTKSNVTAITGTFDAESSYRWHVDNATALVYVLGGRLRVNGTELESKQLVQLGEGNHVDLEAIEPTTVLLLAGDPLEEPVATGGPFVMNTRMEIYQAFMDFQDGKMGELEE